MTSMSSKPRVLMVASLGDPPYVGGIENVVDTLLNSELNQSFEFSILDTYRPPDPKRTRFEKASYAVRLGQTSYTSTSAARWISGSTPFAWKCLAATAQRPSSISMAEASMLSSKG